MRPIYWIILCITFHQRKRTEGQEVAHDTYTPCITKMALPDGDYTITSNGYPDGYVVNRRCIWELDTTRQYQKNLTITLNFVNVDIANTTNCLSDYIKIYSASYCNKQFRAGTRRVSLTSENYPSPYPSFMRCTYLILPRRQYMNVKFTVSVSELDFYCRDEYVLVYDGKTEDSPLLGKWCGNGRPTYKSLRGSLYIVFVSKDNSYTKRRGFRALYEEEMCGETITTRSGLSNRISFPPSLYQTFKEYIRCEWTINAFSDKENVFAYFTNTDIFCDTSEIEVKDGDGSTTTFCGSSDELFISTLNTIVIKLRTDLNDRRPPAPAAFSLQYWSGRTDGCGSYGPVQLAAGFVQKTLESPGYPFRYPKNARCFWEIYALFHLNKVKITVGTNDLDPTGCQDYIAFYNARAKRIYDHRTTPPAMKVCGTDIKTFYSEKDHATVYFYTNDDIGSKGFVLYYQSYTPEDDNSPSAVLVGVLVGVAVIVFIIVVVCVCVGRKHNRCPSREPAYSNDTSREPASPFLVTTPTNDPIPAAVSAPPPSYLELSSTPVQNDHLDVEPSEPCLPPPSYEDAISKGMLVENTSETGV